MGESKFKYFSGHNQTWVLWNSDDYPIPVSPDLPSIYCNIIEALERMGFYGHNEIRVYGDHLNHKIDELRKTGFRCTRETSEGYNSAVFQMPLQMMFCAHDPSNFLVIAKQSPETELHRVLQCLKSRNHTVLVVDDTAQASLFHSVESVVDCTHLLGGGKPRSKISDSHTDNEEDASSQLSRDLRGTMGEDLSNKIEFDLSNKIEFDLSNKIEDFSEHITPVKGAKTVVFWDVEDCPFPLCSSPDSIYLQIDNALRDRGCTSEMSIWAYVDENNGSWKGEFLRKKTWKTRIYFLPGGASRRNRMLNDILLWVMDSDNVDHRDPVNLIVVSDQFRDDTYFFQMLRNLSEHRYYYSVFLGTQTQHGNKQESPESEWPGLLLDEAYVFDFGSESSELSPKRHKADAAEETH